MHVLIAEDDPVSLRVAGAAVRKLGHQVTVAENGAIAWKFAQELPIDVILSDWMMPEMDGEELCRRVRAGTQSTYVYFLFLTSLGERERFLQAMQVGADDYLIKPLDVVDLQVRLTVAERVTTLYQEVSAQRVRLQRLNEEGVLLTAAITRNLAEGICAFSPDGRITLANTAAQRLLGRTEADLRGVSIAEICPEVLDDFVRAGHSTHRSDTVFRVRLGSTIPVDYVCSPISETNRALGGVVAFRDISAEKKAEQERAVMYQREQKAHAEAQRALAVRDQFLSLASHELKTPLAVLQLQVQKMRSELTSHAARTESLESLEKQIRRITRLANDMLAVATVGDAVTLNLQRVDLLLVVRRVVERYRGEAQAAGCDLTVRGESPVAAEVDASRIQHMLSHLVGNAIQYAPGTPIEIGVEGHGPFVLLSVKDSGPGIPAQDQARLFNRFEQGDTVAPARGLGLGLYIVREIAEAHGGKVQVMSERFKGTTFTVLLPTRARTRASVGGNG